MEAMAAAAKRPYYHFETAEVVGRWHKGMEHQQNGDYQEKPAQLNYVERWHKGMEHQQNDDYQEKPAQLNYVRRWHKGMEHQQNDDYQVKPAQLNYVVYCILYFSILLHSFNTEYLFFCPSM
jgi:hypothetical protein